MLFKKKNTAHVVQQLISDSLKVVPPEDLLILSLESKSLNWKLQLFF